jgi:NitT/TauT family transport system substrate-binding protein
MRRKHHIRTLTASVGALALLVAACGDDDSSDDASADTEATDTEAPAETDAADDGATDDAAVDGEAETEDTTADTTSDGADISGEGADCESIDEVSLQLQWVTQAQFAGYFAAQDQGFNERYCLDVTLIEAGIEVPPQQVLANGEVDYAIAWVPKALATREAGADIVNVAQIFQRSGTLQVSFVDAGITEPADFAGKKIGNWGYGNEYEVFAAMGQAGLDPATDVENVAQQFDMVALLDGDIDAAEAMTYNEYAQVLEAENPETGELYQPEDLNVISYEEIGVGMLQDAIWADGQRLADDEAYQDITTRFLAASMEGWAYCRDNPEECRDIVVAAGSTLGNSHQLWQMNEVNKLIWPSENGIGYIDQDAWDQTVAISLDTPNLDGETIITAAPDPESFTNDYVEAAHELLGGQDISGSGWEPIEVTLEPGGE